MGRLWVAAVLVLVGGAARAEDDDQQRPFPHRASINLNTGGTFYVEGRITIPPSVTITVKKDVRVVARGSNATLAVEGSLQIKGMEDREVLVDGVVIEPEESFEHIRLMDVKFSGGGVRVPKEKTTRGRLVVENAVFDFAAFDVAFRDGEINLINAQFRNPVKIRAAGDTPTLKLDLSGCRGFLGGLAVHGATRVLVRNCRLGGGRVELVDCAQLTFDGNKVDCGTLLLKQTEPGCFRRTKFLKCDVVTTDVRFESPRGGKKDFVTIDKCWFNGLLKKDEILAQAILDGRRNEESGTYVRFRKINKRPLQLGGEIGN